jgi:hypothetical protein
MVKVIKNSNGNKKPTKQSGGDKITKSADGRKSKK